MAAHRCGLRAQTTVYTPVGDVDGIVQSFTVVGTFANLAEENG